MIIESYLLDPKHQLLVGKNKEGQSVSQNEEFQLRLERVYKVEQYEFMKTFREISAAHLGGDHFISLQT